MGTTKRLFAVAVVVGMLVGTGLLSSPASASCVSVGGPRDCPTTPRGGGGGGGGGDGAPLPVISIHNERQLEGTGESSTTTFSFRVTRAGSTSAASSVKFKTVEGTAVEPEDYQPESGRLKFAAGVSVRKITVQVVADSLPECSPESPGCHETFTVKLSKPSGATIGDAKGTGEIVDDDEGPQEP